MADTKLVTRPAATAWGAVLGGWVATIGASVIFAPLVAGVIGATGTNVPTGDLVLAAPVVLGILVSYLVGGYVAGRMAGYRTSWHGMMTAFFSLFILLLVLLLGAAADAGMFAGSGIRSLGDLVPGVRDLNIATLGDALSFGAILGFLAAIFGGWLGGLLAPSHAVVAAAPAQPRVIPAPQREPERAAGPLPAYGHKGGERAERRQHEERRDTAEGHRDTRVERG